MNEGVSEIIVIVDVLMNKETVAHIQLLTDLEDKRLKRDAGDFLCGKEKGKQWVDQKTMESIDGNGEKYQSKVTCKDCIKVAKRW